MDLMKIVKAIDAPTARAFVTSARSVIDAMLIESARADQMATPAVRDYGTAELSREAPAGGWITHDELRQTTQELAEAIAVEKWIDGVALTIRLFAKMGIV